MDIKLYCAGKPSITSTGKYCIALNYKEFGIFSVEKEINTIQSICLAILKGVQLVEESLKEQGKGLNDVNLTIYISNKIIYRFCQPQQIKNNSYHVCLDGNSVEFDKVRDLLRKHTNIKIELVGEEENIASYIVKKAALLFKLRPKLNTPFK